MAGIWNSPWDKNNDWYNKMLASGQYWNDFDLAHASQDQNCANTIFQAKSDYANATTDDARALANANAEAARQKYSYTSGTAGAEYNPYGTGQGQATTNPGINWGSELGSTYQQIKDTPSFSYEPFKAPDPWGHSAGYNNAYANVLDYGPFSYDYKSDPLYSVYAKEYTREGQRASADALAQAAAMTGGVPSSYANTAAQQAGNYYASKLADAIPALRQQAYNEYNQNFQNMLAKYNAAHQNDAFDYGVYSDDYNRAYQQWGDKTNLDYKINQDDYARMLDQYGIAAQNYETEMAKSLDYAKMLASLGDYSALDAYYGGNGALGNAYADANAIYAFADDGGEPYKIGSTLGQNYLNSLMPGQSVTGGDGSVWSMDDLGNITITKDGKTWSIKSGKTGGRGGGGKVEDTTPFSDATWKQIAQAAAESPSTAAALLQQYWNKLTESQKNILARNAGVSAEDLKAMGGIGAYGQNDFATWASFLPSPAASGDIYQQMYDAGITTEAEAKRWLQQNGYDKYTEANDAAKTYANLFGSGSFGNATPSNLVTNITSEVKDYKSAVNYLQNNGITAEPLTQEQWAMSSDKSKFATYKDYLQSFTYEYMNG